MANPNDTSKSTPTHRDHAGAPAAPAGAAPIPLHPPLTLEQLIENQRTVLLQGRAMLHCLQETLLYADDDDSIMHADVVRLVETLLNEAAERLDSVYIKPLIDALGRQGGREERDEPGALDHGPYQVREPRLVYYA